MNKLQILIVEDDAETAEVLAMYLQAANFGTHIMVSGDKAVSWVRDNAPALIILDIMLPGKDGHSICKEIRHFSQVPIIMTTAKVEEVDRLIGLEIGADDYVCKPYSVKEVVARVKANVRHIKHQSPLLIADSDNFRLSYQACTIELTAIEFSLFHLLYSHPNRIFSRRHIMERVYPDNRDISDRTVDSHIRNMRKKLATLPLEKELIRSIYGAGYKYEAL